MGAVGMPGWSYRAEKRPSHPWSTAGARPHLSPGCPGRWPVGHGGVSGGRDTAPGPVPAVPAADPPGGPGPGPRGPRADGRHPRGAPAPRVPVLRASRDGQDLHGPHPGQDGQLRAGAHGRAVRRVFPVRRDPRGHAPGRRRDRRRQPRWGGGRSRTAREGAHRAGAGSREGLHHRRGAAALPRGVRCPAEGLRGTAARRAVRAGHHRAAQDAGHDRRPVPAVRLPSVRAGDPHRAAADDRRGRGHLAHGVGGPLDRPAGRGVLARRALPARPGRVLGGDKIDDDVVHALLGAPRGEVQHELADSVAVGDARGVFEIVGRLVQDGQDLRNVTAETLGPLPEPAPGQDRAGPAGPARRARPTRTTSCGSRPRSSRPPRSRGSSRCCWPRRTTCGGPPRRGSRSSWRWSAPRIPETDPTPAGLVARLERLERLAHLDPTAVVPTVADVDHAAGPPSPADDVGRPVEAVEPPVVEEAPAAAAPSVDPAPSEPRTSEVGSAEAAEVAPALAADARSRRPPTRAASMSPCSGVPGPR